MKRVYSSSERFGMRKPPYGRVTTDEAIKQLRKVYTQLSGREAKTHELVLYTMGMLTGTIAGMLGGRK